MGWKEYYHDPRGIRSFLARQEIKRIIGTVLSDENISPPDRKPVFVLGGFHPFGGTTEAFSKICHSARKENCHRILLDFNSYPHGFPQNQSLHLQARLEELPFANQSVDFFHLDYTTDFMKDYQVVTMAKEVNRVLSANGIISICSLDPLFPGLASLKQTLINHVDTHTRHPDNLVSLVDPLKPIYKGSCSLGSLILFCRKSNQTYSFFSGEPFALDK